MSFTRLGLFLLAATPLCVAQMDRAQADREKDVYAIYSLLLTNPRTSHAPGGNTKLLILDTTVPAVPERQCLHAEGSRQSRLQEILDGLQTRQGEPQKLERKLDISQRYELLTASEAEQFRSKGGSPDLRARFAGALDLFSFSNVHFDVHGTLALVHITSWCGSLCGLFRWATLEKQADGSWIEVPGVSCIAIASAAVRVSRHSH